MSDPETRRIEYRRVDPGVDLGSGIDPLLQQLYVCRGIRDARQLDAGLQQLAAPRMLGLPEACDLLVAMLASRGRILVVGDFDADGACSCALAVLALRALGAAQVDYMVPNRFRHGYGLSVELIAQIDPECTDLIVTVDNGIASIEGVRAARDLGIAVIVTDHHLAGPHLPLANAIVNPNQPGCPFPSKALAGVGVLFYLLLALRARLRTTGWFLDRGIEEPNLAQWLDLVALGTIADLVPLDSNNRILVAQGLARIRAGRCRPGIRALALVAGAAPERIVSRDIGFSVAPRLNAAGRMEDMSLGIECLLSDDCVAAAKLASQLHEINQQRRQVESTMQESALRMVESLDLEQGGLPSVLCLHDGDWHQGVIGILAARIRQRTHRPAVVFSDDGHEGLKGSARSIPGLHIRDALAAVDSGNPGLIERFGGHAMAAGLSLRKDSLAIFRRALTAVVDNLVDERDLAGVIVCDGELQASRMNLHTARLLEQAGPWGQGFPEPVFDGCFEVLDSRVIRDRHLKLVLRPGRDQHRVEAIAFNAPAEFLERVPGRVRLVYRMEVNEWQGRQRLQLVAEVLQRA